MSDAGLQHLKGLTALQNLYLGGTQISDIGLEQLKEMTSLKTLAAAFSPDGSHIISVTRDERLQIWDATNGNLLGSATGSGKGVIALAHSRDGTTLATCGGNKVIKI